VFSGNAPRLLGPAFTQQSRFWKDSAVVFAKGTTWLTNDELWQKLNVDLQAYLVGPALRPASHFDDSFYYLPTMEEVGKVLAVHHFAYPDYIENVFDCEDYAYATKVEFSLYRAEDPTRTQLTQFACGIIWGCNLPTVGAGDHAVNFVATDDAGIVLIDCTIGSETVTPLPPERPAMAFNHIVI
jgi:hypothetical protein